MKSTIPNFRTGASAAALIAGVRAEEPESEEDKKKREDEEKAAKKAEEDEEAKKKSESEEKDDDEKEKEKEARSDERRRIKAILTSDLGVRFPKAAQRLAFEGSLSASDALAMLEAVSEDRPAQASGRLADRMSTVQAPALGAGDVSRGSAPSLAARIIQAGAKARGEAA